MKVNHTRSIFKRVNFWGPETHIADSTYMLIYCNCWLSFKDCQMLTVTFHDKKTSTKVNPLKVRSPARLVFEGTVRTEHSNEKRCVQSLICMPSAAWCIWWCSLAQTDLEQIEILDPQIFMTAARTGQKKVRKEGEKTSSIIEGSKFSDKYNPISNQKQKQSWRRESKKAKCLKITDFGWIRERWVMHRSKGL